MVPLNAHIREIHRTLVDPARPRPAMPVEVAVVLDDGQRVPLFRYHIGRETLADDELLGCTVPEAQAFALARGLDLTP